jgi:hypothetical protein
MHMDILRRIVGIEVFPVVSLVLFVAVFTLVLVRTIRLDAAGVARAARLPLDGAEPAPQAATRRPSASGRHA